MIDHDNVHTQPIAGDFLFLLCDINMQHRQHNIIFRILEKTVVCLQPKHVAELTNTFPCMDQCFILSGLTYFALKPSVSIVVSQSYVHHFPSQCSQILRPVQPLFSMTKELCRIHDQTLQVPKPGAVEISDDFESLSINGKNTWTHHFLGLWFVCLNNRHVPFEQIQWCVCVRLLMSTRGVATASGKRRHVAQRGMELVNSEPLSDFADRIFDDIATWSNKPMLFWFVRGADPDRRFI